MATWKFEGLDEYREQLKKLEYNSIGLCKYALYEGAKVIADAVKERIPVGEDETTSGDLRNSMSLNVMKKKGDLIYTQISFVGYDRKGVPNQLKANVLESGTSKKKKRPFIRPAMNASSAQAEQAMKSAMDQRINQYFK